MKFEEFKKYVDETLENIYSKLNEEEKTFISDLVTKFNQQCKENEELKRSYAHRENKWEKFKTQKDILSSNMSNYLCKYQNLKREYKIQNGHLHKYKQENQRLKDVMKQAIKLVDELYDIGEEWYWDSYIIKEYVEKIGKILKGDKEC